MKKRGPSTRMQIIRGNQDQPQRIGEPSDASGVPSGMIKKGCCREENPDDWARQ